MEKKLMIGLFLLGLLAFGFTSCSDDDSDTSALETEKDKKELLEAREQAKTEGIVQKLCHVTMLEDSTFLYEPAMGKALYEITPTVYYEPVSSLEEAEQAFRRIISPLNTDSLENESAGLKEVVQGDVHLKFEQGSSSKELAKIVVDCPRLHDVLTEIVFMPKDQWPENDNESPFTFLSVWRQNSTKNVYICVRASQGGPGLLLTFDGGWREDWYKNNTYFQGQFHTWIETCRDEDIEALGYCLRDNYDMLSQACERMLERGGNTTTYNILNGLLQAKGQYKVKGHDFYSFDTKATYKNKYWWAKFRWYYIVNTSRAGIDLSNYHVDCWTNTVEERTRPWLGIPSHAIYFNSGSYWEYRVTDTEEKYAEKKKETKVSSWEDERDNNWECLFSGI